MKRNINFSLKILFLILSLNNLFESKDKNFNLNTLLKKKNFNYKSNKNIIEIEKEREKHKSNSNIKMDNSNIKMRNNGDKDSNNNDNSNEKDIFEGLISKLKESVVMIDINSDVQFFEEKSVNSKATGFIVNKEYGLIATNKHVTRISPTTHRINFLNGAVEKGNVVYYDFYHDFGFIQLEKAKDKRNYLNSELYKSMKEVEFGSSYDLKKNELIMLIGNNEGVNYSIKYGNVINLNMGNFNGLGSIIMTNFDRSGGSSGSPIWNSKGKVVAIHAMGNSLGSYEVPIDYMKDILNNYEKKIKDDNLRHFFSYDKGYIGGFYSLVPQFKIQNLFRKSTTNTNNLLNSSSSHYNSDKEEIENFFKSVKEFQRDQDATTELIQINSIIPEIAEKNDIRSGDIIMKLNDQIIGNDLILFERMINQNIKKTIHLKILRFGQIKDIRNVKVISTENEKVFRFLKISNTILHDVNLYIKMFNPLIPQGIVISKIGLGSPFNELSNEDGPILLRSYNSKKIRSIDDFLENFKTEKDSTNDNIDIIYLNNMTMKVYNFFIDFGNVQEIYLYEFDNNKGIWIKNIIKVKIQGFLNLRNSEEKIIINDYENNHIKPKDYIKQSNEFNKIFSFY
jgi:S1-C subfamily serine protease